MAFTLVELVVVITIIVVLATIAVVVGKKFLDNAKGRDTAAMLNVIKTALDQFESEHPLKNVVAAYKRYGDFPPDELEAFARKPPPTNEIPVPMMGATPAWPSAVLTIGPGARLNVEMGIDKVEHRDTKAMMLGIRLYSSAGSAILDKIADRFVSTRLSSVEVTSIPGQVKAQFFDSNFGQSGNDPIRPGPEDIVLTYPVDAWGDPVEYYATNPKPYPPGAMPPVLDATPAGAARLAFSQMAIGRNNGRPFLVSYGQDGPDQLAGSMPVTLISDWNMGMPAAIDHPYNNDNVYSEPDLKDKLRQP